MKKSLFLAALAVVAMAACTKNELKVPSKGTDAEISFQPVVANATKATYLTTANMKEKCTDFAVFAWYAETELTASSSTTAYMNNVKVSYSSTINDSTTGEGAWAPATTYYWPKNGTLSFDAYAPASAHATSTPVAGKGTVSSTAANGLKIENYTVADLDEQYDLLYSARTLNKKTSEGGSNDTYDGVDITFKHALAAIEVKAKTKEEYGTGVIKLKKVTIQKAYNKGAFAQGMTDAVTEGTPAWTPVTTNEADYVLFSGEQALTTTATESPTISNAILLPQSFTHSPNKVSIKVDYTIKCDAGDLDQTETFNLSATTVGSTAQTGWEMGKKYTYTFIFSLDKVYFAPTVTVWEDKTVDNINVQ